jgi:hypothetical protein
VPELKQLLARTGRAQSDAEQKKFHRPDYSIRLEEQRNLAVAQSNEVRALVDFTKAKNNLDRAVGKTPGGTEH